MATLFDKLFNRVIKGKLTIEDTDELSSVLKKAVEQADSSEIYELHTRPTDSQLIEALKHKFLKFNDIVYVLSQTFLDNDYLYTTYVSVFGADDGLENSTISFINISRTDNVYDFDIHHYDFSPVFDAPLLHRMTHSINELNETLKGIIEDAIADNYQDGVACTSAQWEIIKSLLDKSLYFDLNGYALIKTFTNGNTDYGFGCSDSEYGFFLNITFNPDENHLYAKYIEV